EARRAILTELTSDNSEVRAEYLTHFDSDVEEFAEAMAKAFRNWRALDGDLRGNEKRAYVSALVFSATTLHILSLKLLVSGHLVPAGSLMRQVVESISLALLCSGSNLDTLNRFMTGKYSTNNAVRDVLRNSANLGVNDQALKTLAKSKDFYNKYSHPSHLTIASGMSFSNRGTYVGATFDEGKLQAYTQEIQFRLALAKVFSSFIDCVKANIAKW
ncbi:MAG: hypothetical protein ABIU05_27150, partial [Nitrospirales bacterium]